MLARDYLGEWPTPTDGGRLLSNIVMMGMGEPLYNFENVKQALKIVMDEEGIALSRRRDRATMFDTISAPITTAPPTSAQRPGSSPTTAQTSGLKPRGSLRVWAPKPAFT